MTRRLLHYTILWFIVFNIAINIYIANMSHELTNIHHSLKHKVKWCSRLTKQQIVHWTQFEWLVELILGSWISKEISRTLKVQRNVQLCQKSKSIPTATSVAKIVPSRHRLAICCSFCLRRPLFLPISGPRVRRDVISRHTYVIACLIRTIHIYKVVLTYNKQRLSLLDNLRLMCARHWSVATKEWRVHFFVNKFEFHSGPAPARIAQKRGEKARNYRSC